MFEKHLSQPYLKVRGLYDVQYECPSVGNYNMLRGSIENLKSSYTFPDKMYNAVNRMQEVGGRRLGGLEKKFW